MAFQVAERWFERKKIDDDITLVWEPHVDPLGRCNIWHVRGTETDLLVDTGMGIAELKPAVADLFGKGVIAFATHTHFDHVGSLHEFENRIVSKHEAASMETADNRFSLYREDMAPEVVTLLKEAGYEIAECLIDALPHPGYDARAYRVEPAKATRVVDEGDHVSIGNRSFEVIHLPGHSPGSVGLWEAETGTLFSGDSVYDGPLLDMLPESDVVDYCRTMERLIDLPVTVVHAGHEPSFGRERLVELCRSYLDLRAEE